MDERLTTITVVDEPDAAENLALVALTPAEMPDQQAALAAWCERKVAAVERELGTWRALEEEAVTGGFKHATYTASARRTEKRIVYYRKIKAAIEAGYLIVPNMPVNLFAVRVARAGPRRQDGDYAWSRFPTTAESLPAGEGRYVSATLPTKSHRYTERQADGKELQKTAYFADEYNEEIDFPLRGVHPRVLQASAHAKALRLFDELGVVENSGGGRDPIVVGRVLDPRGNGRCATFFVAWWLNCNDL